MKREPKRVANLATTRILVMIGTLSAHHLTSTVTESSKMPAGDTMLSVSLVTMASHPGCRQVTIRVTNSSPLVNRLTRDYLNRAVEDDDRFDEPIETEDSAEKYVIAMHFAPDGLPDGWPPYTDADD